MTWAIAGRVWAETRLTSVVVLPTLKLFFFLAHSLAHSLLGFSSRPYCFRPRVADRSESETKARDAREANELRQIELAAAARRREEEAKRVQHQKVMAKIAQQKAEREAAAAEEARALEAMRAAGVLPQAAPKPQGGLPPPPRR